MAEIKINDKGFVEFKNRSFGFTGDRGSWAKVERGQIVVCRAAKGIISGAYEQELRDFCSDNGIDWDGIRPGNKASVEVPK
jgi:hypothetical protein